MHVESHVYGEQKYTFLSVNINFTRTPCSGNNICSCHNLILRQSSVGWNGQIRTWAKFHGQYFEMGISNSLPTLIVLVHKRRKTMPWWHGRYGGMFESGFLLHYFIGYSICINSLFLNYISSHNSSTHGAITLRSTREDTYEAIGRWGIGQRDIRLEICLSKLIC